MGRDGREARICLPQIYLKIFIDQKVAADEIKEAQFAFQLGFDGEETLQHDFFHSLLQRTEDKNIGRGGGWGWSPKKQSLLFEENIFIQGLFGSK